MGRFLFIRISYCDVGGAYFVEEISEANPQQNREILELICRRMKSLFEVEDIRVEKGGEHNWEFRKGNCPYYG
ncbi:MAG: hypothetical protein JSW12_15275 [Deltaproteobacteria bacterium]|nr:MAG: hypothetical protein JSW12_15275 [Deltaproteobacteria bacterium]